MKVQELFEATYASGLAREFLSQLSPQKRQLYSKRGHTMSGVMAFADWLVTNKKLHSFKVAKGQFKLDNASSHPVDFTKDVRSEFGRKQAGDFNNPQHRQQFIDGDNGRNLSHQFVKHAWIVSASGEILDPIGQLQFVDTGLVRDLNSKRYIR